MDFAAWGESGVHRPRTQPSVESVTHRVLVKGLFPIPKRHHGEMFAKTLAPAPESVRSFQSQLPLVRQQRLPIFQTVAQ